MRPCTKTFAAVLLAGILIWACGKDGLQLNIRFARVDGLKTGDRVILDETAAGQVSQVVYESSGEFTVTVVITPEFSTSATQNSRFVVIDDPGQPGDKAVAIYLLEPGGTPLADDAVVEGATPTSVLLEKWQSGLDQGMDALNRRFEQMTQALKEVPLQEAMDDVKNMLAELRQTMAEAGEATRDRIRRDILPKIQQEIERLREALRALGREEEVAPLEVQLEEIRRV